MSSSTGTGWLLLVLAIVLAGFGLWSIVRPPVQMLWGQSMIGRVNTSNNWMFNDADGSEPSPAGKMVLRVLGLGLLAGAVVILVLGIKRI